MVLPVLLLILRGISESLEEALFHKIDVSQMKQLKTFRVQRIANCRPQTINFPLTLRLHFLIVINHITDLLHTDSLGANHFLFIKDINYRC